MRECPKCGLRYADTIKYCSQDGAATVEVARAASDGRVVDGRYELLERMGGSATSPIYRARDLNINSEVAIRILPSEFFPDEASRARLRRNMEAVARLQHPNLVTVYNIVEALDSVAPVYIIMELVQGESLRALLKRSGRLDAGRAIRLMRDICAGVGTAHKYSLEHGNLKPENILITTSPDGDETAKVLNLGIAISQRDNWADRKQIIGTPLYISPEIWRGEMLDARSDVYSLGIIFYEMLAGAPPFSAQEIAILLKMHLNEAPPPLPQTLDINREIEAVIMRALSKNPDERQQDANALADHLNVATAAFARFLPDYVIGSPGSEEPTASSGSTMFTGTPTVAMGEPPTTELMPGVTQEEEAAPRAAVTESKPIYMDENVQFTVYRPRTIPPQKWYPLLAFAHLSERPPDASPDELNPIEQIEDEAKRILGDQIKNYSDVTADGSQAIPREGVITFVPVADGLEFNPPSRSFIWQESVHREEFRLRASPAVDGQTIRGRLSVFLGSILIADINLSIRVDSSHVYQTQLAESATAQPYRKIFPSYSHMDRAIVEQIEHYAEISGDKYMRDVRELRSGQDWRRWMKDAIRDADIFQLFWSRNSMRSENVREEWEYALSLQRQHFIRPTYWETPLPISLGEGLPPEALLRLHFQPLVLLSTKTADEDDQLKGGGDGKSKALGKSGLGEHVTLQKAGAREAEEIAEQRRKEESGRTAFEAPTLAFGERPKIADEEARRTEEAKAEQQRREEREREEEEAKRRLEAEAQRKREEEEARLRAEEEARLRAEEEARRAAELEAKRQLLETRQFPQEAVPTLREQQQMAGELEPTSLGGARYDVPTQEPLLSSRDAVQMAHENQHMSSPMYGPPAQSSTKSIVPILILLSLIAFILLLLLIIGGYIVYRLS